MTERGRKEALRQQGNPNEGALSARSREPGEGLVIVAGRRIAYANEAFCELSGYGLAELKALPDPTELVAEEDRASLLEQRRRCLSGRRVEAHHGAVLRRKDGRRVDVETAFAGLEVAGRTGFLVLVRDVAARKGAEEALRRAESRYRTLVEQIPAITYTNAPDSPADKLYVSPQIEPILGVPAEEWTADPRLWIELLHPDDRERVVAEVARSYATGEPLSMEYRMVARDGRVVWFHDEATTVRDDAGQPYFHHGVMLDVTGRVRAVEEIRLQARLLDAVGQAVIATDPRGETVYWNRAAEQLYGWAAGEVLGRPLREFVVPEDLREWGDEIVAGLRAGRSWSGEFVVRRKDGTTFPAMVTNTPVHDEQGNLLGMIGVSADVTERKRAEGALRESERRLRTVVANAPVVLFAVDREGVFVLSEGKGLEALGLEPGGVLGLSAFEVYRDAPEVVQSLRRALAGEEFNALVNAAGLTFETWFSTLRKDEGGEVTGVIGVATDVTERKRVERALRESEERFRSAFGDAAIGMALVGNDGRWLQVNRSLCGIVGYSEGELLGKTYGDITHPDDLVADLEQGRRLLAGEIRTYQMEKRYFHKLGHVVRVLLSVSLVRDANGDPLYSIAQIQDITERKRAEEALRESEEHYRQQARELALLHEVRTALARELDPPDVLRTVVEAVARAYGYTQVSAYLLEGEELVLQHQVGYGRVFERIPVVEGVMGRVVRTGEPVLLEDASTDPAFLGAIEGIVSEVCVPLFAEGRAAGTLNVESTGGVRLTRDDLRLMGALAEHVGIAVGRARLHARVRESEERFRSLVQNASDIITILEADGTIRYQSPAVERVLGYRPEERIGTSIFDQIHADDVERASAKFARLLANNLGIHRPLEFALPHKDGSWRYLEHVANNLLDDPGVRGVVVNSRDITERKEAEEALRESEERYRLVARATNEVIWDADLRTGEQRWDGAIEATFGYPQREPMAPGWWEERIHPEDRERVLSGIEAVIREGEAWSDEYRFRRADGLYAFVVDRGHVVRDGGGSAAGEAVRVVGSMMDITERKRAERRLEESEQRYRSLFEQNPDAVYSFDLQGNFLSVNPACEKLSGYARGELLRMSFAPLIVEEDLERTVRHFQGAVRGEPQNYENAITHKDGHRVELNVTKLPMVVGGEIVGVYGIAKDITERKRAEEALKRSEERYRAVVERTTDGIFLSDSSTKRILESNGALQNMLGYTSEELRGMSVYDVIAEDRESIERNGRRIREDKSYFIGERCYRRKDGSLIHVESSASLIPYGGKQASCCIVRDITERKRAEEAMRRQNGYLSALHETSLALMDRLQTSDLLGAIVARATALLDTSHGYVYLVGQDGRELEVRVGTGVFDEYVGCRIKPGEGLSGRVWETGQPLVVDDYRDWEGKSPQFDRNDFCATAAAPLKSGTEVVGVIGLTYLEEGRRLGEEEMGLLSRFAELASIALDNARLYSSAQQELAERTRTEEALRESEAGLAEAQRIAHLGSFEWDVVTGEVSWSDETFRIYGYRPGQFVPTFEKLMEVIHPQDRDLVEGAIEAALYDLRPYDVEHRVVLPDGSVRVVHRQAEVVFGEDGRPLRMLGTVQDVTERKALEERLEHQALHDPLTDLPNRTLFTNRLEHALARTGRRKKKSSSVAVLFMDLDNFKFVNDSLGHEAGDRLLVKVAERLRACLRPEDTAARMGGDEFTVLLENVGGVDAAVRVAERILAGLLRAPFALGEQEEVFVTPSIGIALGERGASPEDLLRDADAAMYGAKNRGKARYQVFDPSMGVQALEHLRMQTEIRRAIEREEFVVHYQPKVSLGVPGEILGMEALVRWEHPERGLLLPEEFIPLAEEIDLIIPIEQWVLGEACRQAREWHGRHPKDPPLGISVNLSARQFRRADLSEVVAAVLGETGLDPGSLILEVTEGVAMEDAPSTVATLEELKALGVGIAVDDFGTGYSSLSYLKRFPVDQLKIDRAFVSGLGRDPEDRGIVAAVVQLAHILGLEAVAEGVETGEQLAYLRDLGCDLAQGNYLQEPATAEAAGVLLVASSTPAR